MRRAFVSLTTLILIGGTLLAQDRRDSGSRGRALPQNWSRLGLTDEQKEKIHSVRQNYSSKIDDLLKQVRELRRQERGEMEAVLTEAQKARLREIMAERAPGGGKGSDSKPPEDKPAEKKPGEDKKP